MPNRALLGVVASKAATTGCEPDCRAKQRRMLGRFLATTESTPILGQTFQVSPASAFRESNLPTICWMCRLKTTYSPGERPCSSWILATAVCKSRTTSTHSKFTRSILLRMSKGGSMLAPLCNKSGKLSGARLDTFSESSKCAICPCVFRL